MPRAIPATTWPYQLSQAKLAQYQLDLPKFPKESQCQHDQLKWAKVSHFQHDPRKFRKKFQCQHDLLKCPKKSHFQRELLKCFKTNCFNAKAILNVPSVLIPARPTQMWHVIPMPLWPTEVSQSKIFQFQRARPTQASKAVPIPIWPTQVSQCVRIFTCPVQVSRNVPITTWPTQVFQDTHPNFNVTYSSVTRCPNANATYSILTFFKVSGRKYMSKIIRECFNAM